MSLIDYFSSDPNKRAKLIFNSIATIYAKFTNGIEKKYSQAIEIIKNNIHIDEPISVIDIGTGTGVWANMFQKYFQTHKVLGIDLAEKMTKVATKKYPNIDFEICDAEKMKKIPPKSFDIATAAYVLHGVKQQRRKIILKQMKRIARKYVIIHDFADKIKGFVWLLEVLERSDAFQFKKQFYYEMKEVFGNIKLLKTPSNSGIYISKII